jgi:predicted glycoside hydrolase/deacetylase ChbG (UPF0249 family)
MSIGALIVNADDWGRDRNNTDRILECIRRRSVSSTSAMVFMEDSERAAAIAREHAVDAGLHVNFTTKFSANGCSSRLLEHQARITNYLSRHRFAKTIFHPGLASSFKYVISAQLDEFSRLYGAMPQRLDGHHHMHLCANVLMSGLLPAGTIVRRNFSFQPGEKSAANRFYRKLSDRMLSKRHRSVDLFFSIEPVADRQRLKRILDLARHHVVEVETHPVNPDEHAFLTSGEVEWLTESVVCSSFACYFKQDAHSGLVPAGH